jgi:tRNA U34 5-methylaminomethyl-2-thiouridine-forming methyltransferase MnmC
MTKTEIIETADGSHSLFNEELQETYHSRHGAVQESLHVYLNEGLSKILASVPGDICLLEIGFGTGLNALLTLQEAEMIQRKIIYTSLEPYPLPGDIWRFLNYGKLLGRQEEFEALHKAPWNSKQSISPFFELLKLEQSIQHVNLPPHEFHLVYFDAFAPGKQPEMWRPEVFTKLKQTMTVGAALVTYCAKGQVKRDLKTSGFLIESLPGPPGKREMIRCTAPLP